MGTGEAKSPGDGFSPSSAVFEIAWSLTQNEPPRDLRRRPEGVPEDVWKTAKEHLQGVLFGGDWRARRAAFLGAVAEILDASRASARPVFAGVELPVCARCGTILPHACAVDPEGFEPLPDCSGHCFLDAHPEHGSCCACGAGRRLPERRDPMSASFYLERNDQGKWHWRLSGDDAATLLVSELYESRQGAENGIVSVRSHAVDEKNFRPMAAKDGRYYFTLVAVNHETIGTSPLWGDVGERDRRVKETMRAAPVAPVETP